MIEHLTAIRADVAQMKDDLASVNRCLTSIETQIANLNAPIGHLRGDNAIAHARIDGMEKRLERIERRLDLTSV